MDFWNYHGILFLVFIRYFPRLTIFFATQVSLHLLGLPIFVALPIYIILFIFLPYLLVAILATFIYWTNNPILCCIAWIIFLNELDDERIRRAENRNSEQTEPST